MKQHLHCANSSASNFGSRFAAVYLLLIFSLCVVNLPAKDKQLQFKTIEVKHFTLAEGVALPDKINPQEYLSLFYDELREKLEKDKLADQVLVEGATVPAADAADSIVLEGKIADFKKAGHTMMHPAVVTMEISLFHRADHSLITTVKPELKIIPAAYRNEKTFAKVTGGWTAGEVKKALKQ